MRFRGFFVSFWLVLALACSPEAKGGELVEDGEYRSLEFEPDGRQSLLPGETLDLAVRCRDADGEPLQSVTINLALLDNAPGASLSTISPTTDRAGIARASLRVGSDAGTFRVRATASGAKATELKIAVAKVEFRTVRVDAQYAGMRDLATRTVTARPNVGCAEALTDRMPGQVNQTIAAPRTKFTLDLDPGVPYAVVAWGRDAEGGLLALGCRAITYSVEDKDRDQPDELIVELLDHELTFDPASGPFLVELELDVSASSARLGAAAREAGLAILPQTSEPDADALLDAVAREVRTRAGDAAAQSIAALRSDPAVATSLGNSLRAAQTGPSVLLTELDATLRTSAERLVAEATYSVDAAANMWLQIDAIYGSRAGGLPLALSDALLTGAQVGFAAVFDEPSAEIAVSQLRLSVARDAYGLAVFNALDMGAPPGLSALLSPWLGLKALSTWVAASQPTIVVLCDADCLQRAGDALSKDLLSAARQRIATPSGYNAVTVSGQIWVADRDDNNRIDALGSTSLLGTWHGDAAALPDVDVVTGELRMASPPLTP
jgi:hypothetical protein